MNGSEERREGLSLAVRALALPPSPGLAPPGTHNSLEVLLPDDNLVQEVHPVGEEEEEGVKGPPPSEGLPTTPEANRGSSLPVPGPCGVASPLPAPCSTSRPAPSAFCPGSVPLRGHCSLPRKRSSPGWAFSAPTSPRGPPREEERHLFLLLTGPYSFPGLTTHSPAPSFWTGFCLSSPVRPLATGVATERLKCGQRHVLK